MDNEKLEHVETKKALNEWLKQLSRENRERIDAKLLEAEESFDRGEGIRVTPEYWQKLRDEIIERQRNRAS